MYVRGFHPSVEPNENSSIQERNSVFAVIATSIVLVVLAFIASSLINPTLLTDAQGPLHRSHAYLFTHSRHLATQPHAFSNTYRSTLCP